MSPTLPKVRNPSWLSAVRPEPTHRSANLMGIAVILIAIIGYFAMETVVAGMAIALKVIGDMLR